ncbi:MAG TPA: pyruvate ferredoxin oxidoreductase [Fervidicoccus fontis]|uniref:pyruvate synthase n=1 Tax=Fervidicoccus fontis TaxID=683846 RepID=A0A7C2ZX85_9CREN|nr:pyruvate ferredoxin oxidoreductase [Fervidicoccus fontis]
MLQEIIFYGRGGQGAVTSSELLAAAASYENFYSQAFAFYGAERRGAPVMAFSRISDSVIYKHGMFFEVDSLVVLDRAVLPKLKDIKIRKNGNLLINASLINLNDLKKYLNFIENVKVYTVDANAIAKNEGLVMAGWPLVNTSILGAFIKILGIIKLDSLLNAIDENFEGQIAEKNKKAVKDAYESLKEMGEIKNE